jgi:hypothetical protein
MANSESNSEWSAAPANTPVVLAEVVQPPVHWRELLALVLLAVVGDVAIYRGAGFAGYAMLFLAVPLLLLLGSYRPCWGAGVWMTGVMLAALSAKLVRSTCLL